jgi:hypothetical protein
MIRRRRNDVEAWWKLDERTPAPVSRSHGPEIDAR